MTEYKEANHTNLQTIGYYRKISICDTVTAHFIIGGSVAYGMLELANFLAVVLGLSTIVGVFLHVRNVLNHHDSPLPALVGGCIVVSLFVAGIFVISWVFLPSYLSQIAISPITALLSVLFGTGLLNWMAYGFHWIPEP